MSGHSLEKFYYCSITLTKKSQLAKRLMISKGEKLDFDPWPRNSNYLVTLLFNYPSFIIKMTPGLKQNPSYIHWFLKFVVVYYIVFANSFKAKLQKWKFDSIDSYIVWLKKSVLTLTIMNHCCVNCLILQDIFEFFLLGNLEEILCCFLIGLYIYGLFENTLLFFI